MDYTNSRMRFLIEEYIHSERDRLLLTRRLIDGLSFSELEKEFFLSDKQLKRIVYKLQEELFKHY